MMLAARRACGRRRACISSLQCRTKRDGCFLLQKTTAATQRPPSPPSNRGSSSCGSFKSTPPSRSSIGVDQRQPMPPPPPPPPPACEAPTAAPFSSGRHDDALTRFPTLRHPGGILRGLDYTGTITFALTGSVTAAQSGLDMFGCCMVGMITAVGGGTIRDAIFLSKRPFWTSETEYIWMTILTGLVTFFSWPRVLEWQEKRREKRINEGREDPARCHYDGLDMALDTLDAVGLSAFAIVGAQNGLRAGMPMAVCAICGMSTSTFGGMTRDVLCGRPVRIVHSNAEVYAVPALSGAVTYLVAKKWGATPAGRIFSAIGVCMGIRFVAVWQNVRLHTWDTKNDGLGVAVRK